MNRIILLLYLLILPQLLLGGGSDDCESLIKSSIEASDKKDYITALEMLTKAKVIAENNQLHQQHFWILTNIGINYAEMLDYSEALDNFLEAYKIALKDLDIRNEMSILNNIAGLYLLDKKYDKAEEYFNKVYTYANTIRDSILIGGCAMNLALIENIRENPQQANNYLDVGYNMLQAYPRELLQAKSFRVFSFILEERYDEAEELAKEVLVQLNDDELLYLEFSLRSNLVLIYKGRKETNKAIQYARELLDERINTENRIELFSLLSDLYMEKGDYKQALNYKDSLIIGVDSLNRLKDGQHFENSRIKFELLKNEKELSESRMRLRNAKILGLCVVIIIVLLAWAFRGIYQKSKQRKKIVDLELEQEKNKKLLLEKQLVEERTLSLLEQEKLTREIDTKNRELTSKALFLSNRNDLIENIINSLSNNPEILKNPSLTDSIWQLKKQLKENSEWDSFITYFEQVNQEFISNLREKHPNLTANEIRFLSCIYINLNTKEISSLLNITPEYCKKKKQQIAQKLGLSSTTLLYNYIVNI